MKKLSEIKITTSVFYFFLTVWTIMFIAQSSVNIFVTNQFILDCIIFPEYILYNLFTLGIVFMALMSIFFPLTLLLFYLRMMSVRVSLVWLRRIFIIDAGLFFILVVVAALAGNLEFLPRFLIFLVPHGIIFLKFEPFFSSFEKRNMQAGNN